MNQDEFWQLVNEARRHAELAGSREATKATLKGVAAKLELLPPREVIEFDAIRRMLSVHAHTALLWAAAYALCGGCSADGFIDFKAWLILQGRDFFEAATQQPDLLANLAEWPSCEEFTYAAAQAYQAATGDLLPVAEPVSLGRPPGAWDFEDQAELGRQLPRIAARVATMGSL